MSRSWGGEGGEDVTTDVSVWGVCPALGGEGEGGGGDVTTDVWESVWVRQRVCLFDCVVTARIEREREGERERGRERERECSDSSKSNLKTL